MISLEDETRTAQELFEASFQGDKDDEAAWDAIRVLRLRNTEEIFRLAVQYTQSAKPRELASALNVLAQLGAGKPLTERPHFDESVAIAIAYLSDADGMVVDSAAWALSHLSGDLAVAALIPMRKHPDPHVRLAVASGLRGSERPEEIATLIELMDDPDDNVRDWATFGLGSQCSVNSPEIVDALRRKLGDGHEMVRNEAVWGLAQHKDPDGIRMLIDRLSADNWMTGDEMAAADTLGVLRDVPVEELCAGLQKLLEI